MPTRSYDAPMSAALLPTMPAPSPPQSATANEFRKPSKKRGGETPAQTVERHKKRAKAQATEIHYNKGVALKHAEYLRAVMRRIYPEVRRLQMEDNAAYDEGKLQPRRTALDPHNIEGGEQLVAADKRGYLGLMQPPENPGEHKTITYDQLCDAQAQDNFDALISGNIGDGGEHSALLIKSTRETASFQHVYEHMDAILAPVPFRVGDVFLTPEQRLGIGAAGAAYTRDVYVECKKFMPNGGEIPVSLGLPAGTAPELFFDNCPTGTGKTFSNLIRALLRVVSDEAFENTKREWEAHADRGQPLNNTRIVEYGATSHRQLARVVLFFVPAPLMAQWSKSANEMKQVFLDAVGQTFTVWEGLDVIKRRGRGPNGEAGIYKTLQQAHADAEQYGQAILWLMKAETASTKASMRSAPHLTPVARIYDEAGGEGRGTEPKGKDPESEVKHNQCINATMTRLQKSTRNQPNHPITRALGGDEMRMGDPRHMAILYISTVPDWLRDMVARGMRARMPRGLSLMSFRVKVQSIAAALGHSDMAIQSVDDLITNQLRRIGGLESLQEAEKKSLHTRCKQIMTRSGQYSGNTIADVLAGAMADTNKQLRAVPDDPKPMHPGGQLNHAQQEVKNQLNTKRRVFKAMLRLYESLHTAVCPKEMYECPILMIDITPAETVVMPCCCHVVSQRALESVRNNACPFCREQLGVNLLNHAQLQDMLAPLAQQHVEAEPAADAAGPSAPAEQVSVLDLPVPVGDDERFRAVVKALSEKQWKAGPEASIALIERALEWRGGKGVRILLAFNCGYTHGGTNTSTKKLREMLMRAIPALTSVDFVNGEQTSGGVINYQQIDDTNRVMCVDTATSSVSLAGLNFPHTQLIIFDRVNNRYALKPATMIQAIGRAIRPQAPRENTSTRNVLSEHYYSWLVDHTTRNRADFEPIELEPPESTFPEKLVVFLDAA